VTLRKLALSTLLLPGAVVAETTLRVEAARAVRLLGQPHSLKQFPTASLWDQVAPQRRRLMYREAMDQVQRPLA
jgi:hypothetical protein